MLLIWFLNPIVIVALVGGHPEELLGAVLCAAGVVLATRGRVGAAGILIGLAVINKEWAALAVPVALVALPAARRWRGLLVIAATAAVVLIPLTLVRTSSGGGGASAQLGALVGTMSFPRELLWWFGAHSWAVRESRWVMLLLTTGCSALWWARRRRGEPVADPVADAMLALALVLLLRCALDPWDNLYYHAPFLLALLTYEARMGRTPWLTLAYSLALIPAVVPHALPSLSPNEHAAVYTAIVAPMIVWLSSKLFAPAGRGLRRARGGATLAARV